MDSENSNFIPIHEQHETHTASQYRIDSIDNAIFVDDDNKNIAFPRKNLNSGKSANSGSMIKKKKKPPAHAFPRVKKRQGPKKIERPNTSCPVCNKKFKGSSGLKIHLARSLKCAESSGYYHVKKSDNKAPVINSAYASTLPAVTSTSSANIEGDVLTRSFLSPANLLRSYFL